MLVIMRIAFLFLLSFLSLSIFAQSVAPKDSLRNSYGASLEIENSFKWRTAYVNYGLHYMHRFSSRFSSGLSLGIGKNKASGINYRYEIFPFVRFDLSKKKISPFIDFGFGYHFYYGQRIMDFGYGITSNWYDYDEFFINSRLGLCVVNRERINMDLVFKYSLDFNGRDFFGLGIYGYLKTK